MKKEKSPLIELLSFAAITGNILFILWVSYNATVERFKGTIYQKVSYVVLMGLLVTNIFLILHGRATKK